MTSFGAQYISKLRLWTWGVNELAKRGRPDLLLHLVAGLGDELLCSCIAHEIQQRQSKRLWLMTSRPELFRHNPDCSELLPPDFRYFALARRVGARVVEPKYTKQVAPDRDWSPRTHILRIMLAATGIRGPVKLRPYLKLTANELAAGEWAQGHVVIHSSGLSAKFPNYLKEYFPERLQAVVDAFLPDTKFIQVGSPSDPSLHGVRDLRGQTSIRQIAAILANARLLVGLEGGLMHLARAVDCRAVIIYGGRLWPEQTGYICNENLVRRPPCAPCWGWTQCDYNRVCMHEIAAADVIDAVSRALVSLPMPLAVETADITDADLWIDDATETAP